MEVLNNFVTQHLETWFSETMSCFSHLLWSINFFLKVLKFWWMRFSDSRCISDHFLTPRKSLRVILSFPKQSFVSWHHFSDLIPCRNPCMRSLYEHVRQWFGWQFTGGSKLPGDRKTIFQTFMLFGLFCFKVKMTPWYIL